MKKFKAILAAAVMVASGLAVSSQAVEAASAASALEPVYVAPARLPWGDLATGQVNGKAAAPVLSAAQQKTNKTALKGMPSKSGAQTQAKLAGPTFFYATADQTPPTGTTTAWANTTIASPALSGASHSLAEIAVIQYNGTKRQIVEVGWTQDTGVCGSAANSPCLFTYWWKNEVGQGYNQGTSNGFVPAASASGTPGMSLTSLVGTSKKFGIQYTAASGTSPGCWWLAYDAGWLGCFPDTNWSGTTLGGAGATPAVTFNTLPYYQMFGEIAYSGVQAANTACADMGNGILGTAAAPNPLSVSWGSAALYVNGVQTNANMALTGTPYPTYWNGQITGAGRTHRFGGPGAC